MMVIKRGKGFFYPLSAALIFLSIALFVRFSDERFIQNISADVKQEIMMFDHGFSTPRNILAGSSSVYEIPLVFPKHILKSIALQAQGFPDRPSIDRLELNIKFKNYTKILDDRDRFLRQDFSSDHQEVKATIKYNGKVYNSRLRLKGDYADHWNSSSRMSFRVDLKEGAIFGFKKFSIQKNESRAFPYDQVFGQLARNIGNLAPKQTFAHIFVNGQNWGIMNIEEHMSKELLEKQGRKESLIFKFGNDLDSHYSKNSEEEYPHHRIGDDKLNLSIYQKNKYLANPFNRLLLSYVADERLDIDSSALFEVSKYAKSFVLASAWGNWHALSSMNSRNYFNPYLLKVAPITTDNGPPQKLDLVSENMRNIHQRAFDPYNLIIESSLYKHELDKSLSVVKSAVSEVQNHIDYYQSYFPGDEKIFIPELNKNIATIRQDPDFYLVSDINQEHSPHAIMPTKKQADDFPVHIYARHFTNGNVDIYNLLPDKVTIKSVRYENLVLLQDLDLDGFTNYQYLPLTIKTDIVGVADQKITVVTDYKGNIREHLIDYSLIPGPYFNPLTDIDSAEENFLQKQSDNEWLIKKGEWNVTKPIVLTGTLTIAPGAHITFSENSYLIIKGQLIARGNSHELIEFSSPNSWKGIYVIGNREQSSMLNYVRIRNTRALTDGLLRLTGGVNFYDSMVEIKNTQIIGTTAEDALNIINSGFILDNIEIGGTISDAFDSDFSHGTIVNSSFFNVGGDAVDVSGSDIYIKGSHFNNVRDKAVSVGESSNIDLKNISISDVGVGIVSKDGSNVNATNIKINNYKLYAAMTYVKKDFYGQPSFTGVDIDINPIKTGAFVAQEKTFMSVNYKPIDTQKIDTEALYQNEVMKK
tara:strand:+ start:858 stop:3464 length:2607 start_codon:yes stop_codon:yes gene_type:complete